MSNTHTHPNHASHVGSNDPKNHSMGPESTADEPGHNDITGELQLILASPFFHASKRSQQFLQFVVQYRLDGNVEPLKERTIGAELYHRPAGYATGDDSVVRVQAGEVRRRLEQYYQESPAGSHIRIELPLGSYVPEFRWISSPPQMTSKSPAKEVDPDEINVLPDQNSPAVRSDRRRLLWAVCLVSTLVCVGVLTALPLYHKYQSEVFLKQFWGPAFTSRKPLLICVPKTVLYRPSLSLYKRAETVPGEFDSEVDRLNGRPHLKPDDLLRWGDLYDYYDFGLSKGDVEASYKLSSQLTRMGKDTELRIGHDYRWDDLRNAPSVIIGAFNNQWGLKITSGLHFSFIDPGPGPLRIDERGPGGRSWTQQQIDPRSATLSRDYGLVSRLVNSSTGQFAVSIAGITGSGDTAAAEVASSNELLKAALHDAPRDWSQKNVQIVVMTSVTDGVAGPAQIVAVYVW
jgi:hypothetical protein